LRPLGNIVHSSDQGPVKLKFSRIKSTSDLDARLAQAKGQIVMLDFYADWCVSCKEMDRLTFSDSSVQSKLKSALVLQADVTANDSEDKILLQRFQLFGPPATLFFDAQGKELTDFRVIGYQDATQFINSLQNAGL
jgi:thiol:disulfide interchange protein DsbD